MHSQKAKMFRRPKAGETEEDLLALQEQFMVSSERSSVSLAEESAGSKRKQRAADEGSRDVVQLGGLPPAVAAQPPATKRSKFKERRKKGNGAALESPHSAMEEQDTHITKVLSEVRDRDVVNIPVTMPTVIAKHGFPTVHELDWKSTSTSPHPHTSHPVTQSQKKSLFARHFDSQSPEHFGFELKPTNQMLSVERDKIKPFGILTTPQQPVATPTQYEATPTSDEGARFSSTASAAWAGLLSSAHDDIKPTLISGEGLVAAGVSRETAREEVGKIHTENVERLLAASREELLAERERVEHVLGAGLVAFLRERGTQQRKEESGREEGAGEGGGGGQVEMEAEEKGRDETGTVAPPGWLHMDEVEREKMEWMTDVLPENEDGGPVRFSLEGLVIPRGTSLPPHLALHHHGDEPAAAGYSLAELLGLVRSAVPQQRVLSLSTLARITRRAWCGEYSEVISGCVLTSLCGAGLPLLLRYAVDGSSSAVISAALSCLHSLLVPQWEEYLLREYCDCYHGSRLPCTGHPLLKPRGQAREAEVEGGEKEEGTATGRDGAEEEEDSEVMAKDVVQGYLVTGLLHRLRYVLEVVRPGPTEVTQALEVIARLARHSLQAATEVGQCARLMDTVFREFLPLVWEGGARESVYGVPQPAAMRLVQVLCSASRNLASILLRHKVMAVVLRYMLPQPSELALPPEHAHTLSVTSLQVWREMLCYGLATDWLRDCYPVLARQVFSLPSLSLSSLPLHEATRLAALVWLLEPAVCLPHSSLPHPLTPSLLPPLLSTLPGWVGEGEGVLERLVCVRAVLHVVASHLSSQTQATSETHPVDVMAMATALASPSGLLVTLAGSSLLSTALLALRETSPLCLKSQHLPSPPPRSLPSLLPLPPAPNPAVYGRPVMSDSDYCGFLKPHLVHIASADFLLGFLRLCFAVGSTHRGVVSRVSTVLEDAQFQQYVSCVCEAPPVKYSCLVLGEFQLLYTAVQLFMAKLQVAGSAVGDAERLLYHRLALHLLCLLPPGMEQSTNHLISSVVFHPSLLPELQSLPGSLLERDLSSLSMLHPPQPLSSSSSSSSPSPAPPSSVLATTRDRLPSIPSSLLSAIMRTVYSQQRLNNSSRLFQPQPLSLASLRLPVYSSPLLPADWSLLPLVSLYQHSLTRVSCDLGSEVVVAVADTLHVQLLLEQLRPTSLAHLPPATRLTRTLTTFLIGNDLFLERNVRACLSALLSVYCSQQMLPTIDFTLPIPGLPSFHEFYQSLLGQFAAVSYGDPLFCCYMLLPLQRRCPVSLRRTVWDQHSHTLRLLSLPLEQLPVKLDSFLSPPETDVQLLDLYMGALATDSVRPQWSPVLYLTAVHHLHHFLFTGTQCSSALTPFQRKLLYAIQHMKNKDTQSHLFYYAGPTSGCELGFLMNTELTEAQKTIMQLFVV